MKIATSNQRSFVIPEEEIIRRRDMRDQFTFTIDPADAKDFDDALSFSILEDGNYLVGVHIADVSYFVRPGDDTDIEAYDKGTSTYFVDHVDPMLPEQLCNDWCSLRPDEDKLCMSVIFTLSRDARVVKYKVCRTIIRSNARLAYEQAQEILSPVAPASSNLSPLTCNLPPATCNLLANALQELNKLAQILRRKRFEAGALQIEQEEVRFRLDGQNHPIDIYFDKPTDANHLIEEFMLLANRTIATEMSKRGKDFVYRVHDKPDEEKLKDLHRMQKTLDKMGKSVQSTVIDMLTIRAMAKAVYSTKNIGHYGLAFDYYTHFTSPIRRYPDLMVHRLVAKAILGERTKEPVIAQPSTSLEDACKHCSNMEQLATQAERDSVKEMQTIWIANHLGEEYDGHINGVTDFGLFVQIDANHCEGLVHINSILPGDYLLYDEKNFRLIAKQSGRTWTLGDAVRIKVVRADIDKHQIDFCLISTANMMAAVSADNVSLIGNDHHTPCMETSKRRGSKRAKGMR